MARIITATNFNQPKKFSWVEPMSDSKQDVITKLENNGFTFSHNDLYNGVAFYKKEGTQDIYLVIGLNYQLAALYKAIQPPQYSPSMDQQLVDWSVDIDRVIDSSNRWLNDSYGSVTANKDNVTKPSHLKNKLEGVGLGKDNQGYYVYTHRARSDSYDTPEAIPEKDIKFIESTGSLNTLSWADATNLNSDKAKELYESGEWLKFVPPGAKPMSAPRKYMPGEPVAMMRNSNTPKPGVYYYVGSYTTPGTGNYVLLNSSGELRKSVNIRKIELLNKKQLEIVESEITSYNPSAGVPDSPYGDITTSKVTVGMRLIENATGQEYFVVRRNTGRYTGVDKPGYLLRRAEDSGLSSFDFKKKRDKILTLDEIRNQFTIKQRTSSVLSWSQDTLPAFLWDHCTLEAFWEAVPEEFEHYIGVDYLDLPSNIQDAWIKTIMYSPNIQKVLKQFNIKANFNLENTMKRSSSNSNQVTSYLFVEDELRGGLADNIPDLKFEPESLVEGEEVELEHTDDVDLAKEIAKDHLVEDENYYEKLEKMEKGSSLQWNGRMNKKANLELVQKAAWDEISDDNNRWSGIKKALLDGTYFNNTYGLDNVQLSESELEEVRSYLAYKVQMAQQMINSSLNEMLGIKTQAADVSDEIPPASWTNTETKGYDTPDNPMLPPSTPTGEDIDGDGDVIYDSQSANIPQFETRVDPVNKEIKIKFLDNAEKEDFQQTLQNEQQQGQQPNQQQQPGTPPQQQQQVPGNENDLNFSDTNIPIQY